MLGIASVIVRKISFIVGPQARQGHNQLLPSQVYISEFIAEIPFRKTGLRAASVFDPFVFVSVCSIVPSLPGREGAAQVKFMRPLDARCD
jgi:hypothetical protein